jgi:hypothetical protein
VLIAEWLSLKGCNLVESNRFAHKEDFDNSEIKARERFDWFYWLHKSDPSCPLAKQALDEVSEAYPSFAPKEPHPDLRPYIVSGWVGPSRVPTVEELLEKSPSFWADKLLSIKGADEDGPTRTELIQNISEATKRDFNWSIGLAESLGGAGKWDVYPWYALINTWQKMELEADQYLQVFTWLESSQLYPKHSREIADALYALVKNGGPSYAFQLLSRANQIAEELWQHLDRTISIDVKRGWFNQSVNYPVWGLANFWLSSISLWRQHQDRAPAALGEDYRRPLLEIINDTSPIGASGKSILAGQLRYLLGVDEEWTRKHLLPLFEVDSADFQAVWDGFVTVGRLSPPVAEALKELFLKAVTRISTDLFNQRRGFVKCYTAMVVYVVDDVLDTWIPKFFEYGGQQSQQANCEPTFLQEDNGTIPEIFTWQVGKYLQHMNDSESQELWQRWLKDYWQNRLNGKPAPLSAKEAEFMLEWLPELNTAFPEAVDLAIQMPRPSLQHTRILARLETDKTWEKHPEGVAKLLIFLWGCNIPVWYRDSVSKIITPLLESDISSELKQKLKEISIQLPLDCSFG